jgi:hypothetical protein
MPLPFPNQQTKSGKPMTPDTGSLYHSNKKLQSKELNNLEM